MHCIRFVWVVEAAVVNEDLKCLRGVRTDWHLRLVEERIHSLAHSCRTPSQHLPRPFHPKRNASACAEVAM